MKLFLQACISLLLLAACGGGVGTGGTGSFASGPITGFGSVIVNGVRFDDSSAVVEDGDGNRRSNSELLLGMTVDIESGAVSADNTASASRIRFDSELRGPVGAVDLAGSSFTVLGQHVAVDATTVFAESLGGLAALSVGRSVEVYAVYDSAAARYRAKRVGPAAANDTPRLRGPVSQLDTAAQTLRIGPAVYSYAGASGLPADLAAGQFVRLRVAAAPLSSGRWPVQSFAAALPALPDGNAGSLKGLITAFVSSNAFSVNGRPVDASNASFPDGRNTLALGVRVEVQGSVRGGTLQATRVQVQSDDEDRDNGFELHGAIESVNVAGQSFQLRGLRISTTRSDLRYDNGSAANLVVGRRVQVKGRLGDDRISIEATRISFE
jgi:hypothetical protein